MNEINFDESKYVTRTFSAKINIDTLPPLSKDYRNSVKSITKEEDRLFRIHVNEEYLKHKSHVIRNYGIYLPIGCKLPRGFYYDF